MLGATPMPERFPNLYDRDRWRRWGLPLLVVGFVALVVGAFSEGKRSAGDLDIWLVAAAAGLGISISLWMRARFSFIRLDEGQLFFRYLTSSARVDLSEIRRTRVAKLSAALQRRATTPRRLSDVDALVIRLRQPDPGRLRRLLTRRCVFGDELVIPLANAAVLQRAIESALGPQRQVRGDDARPPSSRRRSRRR
jgi:hypothetical protein